MGRHARPNTTQGAKTPTTPGRCGAALEEIGDDADQQRDGKDQDEHADQVGGEKHRVEIIRAGPPLYR
jgi:hypothetical protein